MSLSIPISRVAFGGDGVGRLPDGKVCFVPGALPGETVLVELGLAPHPSASATRCSFTSLKRSSITPVNCRLSLMWSGT